MKIQKNGSAHWTGGLKDGKGLISTQGGALKDYPYRFATRFEGVPGSNPEELIGAAHAGCYSMFLSALLTNNGFTPTRVHTVATVHLGAGPTITKIDLNCHAEVPGVDEEKFAELATEARQKCPVSKALAAVPEITLHAKLVKAHA